MVTGVTSAVLRLASFVLIEAVRLPIGGDAKMRASEKPDAQTADLIRLVFPGFNTVVVASQTLNPLGRIDCRGLPRRHSAISGHMPAAFRHSGETWPTPAAGH